MKMRSWLLILMLFTSFGLLKAADIRVNVSPQPVMVGEPAVLHLIHSGSSEAKILKFPSIDGVRWLSRSGNTSYSTRIINGRSSITTDTSYPLRITKEGRIRFPALKIRIGNKKLRTDSFSIKVYKRRVKVAGGGNSRYSSVPLEDLLFAKVKLLTDKKVCYVGEEIPLEIQVFGLQGLKYTVTWPDLHLDNIIFRDFSNVHKGISRDKYNPNFAGYRETSKAIDGQQYSGYSFYTAVRPIGAGTLKGKAVINCTIKIPRSRNSRRRRRSLFDSFFDDDFGDPFSSRYQQVNRTLTADFPDIKVKPLPQVPKETTFLGLIGNWKVKTSISADTYRVGEPFTLRISISGIGTLDTLKAPSLHIPGFRVYPPEVEKTPTKYGGIEKGEIKYAMIPLEYGPANIDLTFTAFSCPRGKYAEFPFKRSVSVKHGEKGSEALSVYVDADKNNVSPSVRLKKERAKRRRTEIFYLKKRVGSPVEIPLWKNELLWYILLAVLGPLFWVLSEVLYYRRLKLDKDPLLARKMNAWSRRGAVLRALRKCSADDICEVGQKDVVPYLNDLLSTPPGTSASELADRIKDKDLAECLKELSGASYMPGSISNSGEFQKRFYKAVKKASVIIVTLIICVFSTSSSFGIGGVVNKIITNDEEALTAYDNGDFKSAATYYKGKINPDDPNPTILYNLGNCLYQLGDFSRALVCYERARRLKPGDSDIIENLNFVRRKLSLPEIGKTENPLDLLINIRDSLRPDQWLLGVFFVWFVCFLALAARHYLAPSRWIGTLVIALTCGIVFLFAYFTQLHSTYSTTSAIVVINNVPVYSLPSEKNGRMIYKFKSGEQVQIEEERSNWIRVRADKVEGWVRVGAISRLWMLPGESS